MSVPLHKLDGGPLPAALCIRVTMQSARFHPFSIKIVSQCTKEKCFHKEAIQTWHFLKQFLIKERAKHRFFKKYMFSTTVLYT